MSKITPVEPKLSKESIDYINSLRDVKLEEEITNKQIDEFVKHAINGGNFETYASFMAIIDRYDRRSDTFKVANRFHLKALEKNKHYDKMYKSIVTYQRENDGRIPRVLDERLAWNKQNAK